MSHLPRIFKVLYAREIYAVGSVEFLAHRPEPDLVVVVILAERIQVLRVVVD